MKVKNVLFPCLIGAFSCKSGAQTMRLVPEVGITTPTLEKDVSALFGLNIQFNSKNNFSGFFAGLKADPDKKTHPAFLFVDNFSWYKNILSSWTRNTGILSENIKLWAGEFSPLRLNKNVGDVNLSLSPTFEITHYFNNGTNYAYSTILQATWPISKEKERNLFFELKHSCGHHKNLKDALSFMLTVSEKLPVQSKPKTKKPYYNRNSLYTR